MRGEMATPRLGGLQRRLSVRLGVKRREVLSEWERFEAMGE